MAEQILGVKPQPPTLSAWTARFDATVACIARDGELPHKQPTVARWAQYLCLPCVCGPCCCWSTLWRVAACPVQCACRGASFVCSSCSDQLISGYVDVATERAKLDCAPPMSGASAGDVADLRAATDRLVALLRSEAIRTNLRRRELLERHTVQPLLGYWCSPEGGAVGVARFWELHDAAASAPSPRPPSHEAAVASPFANKGPETIAPPRVQSMAATT
jgi:hypothetical protein